MTNETICWFAGVDWGSEQHQVCVLDAAGKVKGERAFAHGGASVVHGSGVETQQPSPYLRSGSADIARASKLQHAVEDVDCYADVRRPTFVPT